MQNNSNKNVYDNRRDTAKPPMPTTNRVIPRYDEFNNQTLNYLLFKVFSINFLRFLGFNAPQYNNAKSRVNPGFQYAPLLRTGSANRIQQATLL